MACYEPISSPLLDVAIAHLGLRPAALCSVCPFCDRRSHQRPIQRAPARPVLVIAKKGIIGCSRIGDAATNLPSEPCSCVRRSPDATPRASPRPPRRPCLTSQENRWMSPRARCRPSGSPGTHETCCATVASWSTAIGRCAHRTRRQGLPRRARVELGVVKDDEACPTAAQATSTTPAPTTTLSPATTTQPGVAAPRPAPKPAPKPAPSVAPKTAPEPVDPPADNDTGGSPSVGTAHAGSFCSPAGATGVSSRGKPMICGPASDGKNRWHGA